MFSALWRDCHLLIEVNDQQYWGDPPAKKDIMLIHKTQIGSLMMRWEQEKIGVLGETHFGVWMSFCSLAACRQGCTTSSSLISKSRIPLFSTTLAPNSFSSFQDRKQMINSGLYMNNDIKWFHPLRMILKGSNFVWVCFCYLKEQREQQNSCCKLGGLGQCGHLSSPLSHCLCVTGCQRLSRLDQHVCCLPHLHITWMRLEWYKQVEIKTRSGN